MTEEGKLMLAMLLLWIILGLLLVLFLLRRSRPLLRDVFSRDRGLLLRRATTGLADIFFAFLGAFFFAQVDIPAVAGVMVLVFLVVFVTGLTLWLLAGLQLIGLVFGKVKEGPGEPPAEPPPQSSP